VVNDGRGEQDTVSGAPNLVELLGKGRLDPPWKVVVAREGSRLVDAQSGDFRVLKRTKIRGVESSAMLCSERELGISTAHEGVLILDDPVAAGTPARDCLGDVVFDIAITPNMARNASVLGVAREVAALTGASLRHPPVAPRMEGGPAEEKIRIDIREPALNPRFTATLIEGVEVRPSPYWMQRRLRLAGMRPIDNVVDVTNYVMLELGQPLHAFDYDSLAERAAKSGDPVPTLITRLPAPGEKLKTLDGVDRRLDDFTMVVADSQGVLSLAGVMGGEESEVSERSRNVLLEVAAWDFINVRRTVASQQIESEAGYRFSRGVHPELAGLANLRAIELMRELAGGTIRSGMVDVYPSPPEPVVVDLPFSEIERAIPPETAREILQALEFEVEETGSAFRVTVPRHRLDVGEGVIGIADLVEEIARVYGYERIPETQIEDTIPPQYGNAEWDSEERVRNCLVDAGLQEIVSYRITTPEREAMAVDPEAGAAADPYVMLKNPSSSERTAMRREVLPGVLEAAAANSRHRESVALFEIGAVFHPRAGEQLPGESGRLAVVLAGKRQSTSWNRKEAEDFDFFDIKGVVETLADGVHLPDVSYAAGAHPGFRPGRCAAVSTGGTLLGHLGEVHPRVREAYEFGTGAVVAATLDADALGKAIPDRHAARQVSSYPPVVEDLAIVVDDAVEAAAVQAAITRAAGELLQEATLFDLYRSEQIGAGRKSLAFRLVYQSFEKTLTDKDATKARERIVRSLERDFGGVLRS
jgi:phenylalanyl-tRNA synthetase beta chain